MAAAGKAGNDNATACGMRTMRSGGSRQRGGMLRCVLLGLLLMLSPGAAQQQHEQQGQGSNSSVSSGSSSGFQPDSTTAPGPAAGGNSSTSTSASSSSSSSPSPPPAAADDDEGCPEGLSLRCLRSGAWLTSSGSEAAEAAWFVIFIASPFALISIIVLTLGIVDIRYTSLSCSFLPSWTLMAAQALLATFWTLLIPLASYLVARHILPMIAFLVFSCLAAAAHWLLMAAFIQRAARNRALEQPRQQLLTARDKADPKRSADEEAPNPFNAPSLGVIPGTSNMGYILWLPTESSSREDSIMQPGTPMAHGYQAAPSPTEQAGRAALEGRARLMPKPARQS